MSEDNKSEWYPFESEEQAKREVLRWVLEVGSILEDIEETARVEQEPAEDRKESIVVEKPKTAEELKAEIKCRLLDLNLEQLISVALFVGVTEEEIAADLARAAVTEAEA